MASTNLYKTLADGNRMPMVGLGTWQSSPEEAREVVITALETGYRHIDCAAVYQNETGVGEAIALKVKDGTVRREELFVTSKLWNTYHRPDLVREGLQKTLNDLQLDYLDLYLIHSPVAFQPGEDHFPKDAEGNFLLTEDDYVDTYKELEKLQAEGLVKSIGISNFNSKQVQRILDHCTVKPVMNQFEVHPMHSQQRLIDYCRERGVDVTAYSPFGSPGRAWALESDPKPLQDPTVQTIATRLGKTPAQVLVRFAVQRGLCVVPKSATPSRVRENFQVFDFELTPEDMTSILSLNKDKRVLHVSAWKPSKFFPFAEDF